MRWSESFCVCLCCFSSAMIYSLCWKLVLTWQGCRLHSETVPLVSLASLLDISLHEDEEFIRYDVIQMGHKHVLKFVSMFFQKLKSSCSLENDYWNCYDDPNCKCLTVKQDFGGSVLPWINLWYFIPCSRLWGGSIMKASCTWNHWSSSCMPLWEASFYCLHRISLWGDATRIEWNEGRNYIFPQNHLPWVPCSSLGLDDVIRIINKGIFILLCYDV